MVFATIPTAVTIGGVFLAAVLGLIFVYVRTIRSRKRAAADAHHHRPRGSTHSPFHEEGANHSPDGIDMAEAERSRMHDALPFPHLDSARVMEARYHDRMTGNLVMGVPIEEVAFRVAELSRSAYNIPVAEEQEEREEGRVMDYHRGQYQPYLPRMQDTAHGMESARASSTDPALSTAAPPFSLPLILSEQPVCPQDVPHGRGHTNSVFSPHPTTPRGGPNGSEDDPLISISLVAEGDLMLLLSPTTAAEASRQGPEISGLVPVAATSAEQSVHRAALTFHFPDPREEERPTDPLGLPAGPSGSGHSLSVRSSPARGTLPALHQQRQQDAPTLWVRRPSVEVYGPHVPYT